jgi:ribonuclease HI
VKTVLLAKMAANERMQDDVCATDHVFYCDGSAIPRKAGAGAVVYFLADEEVFVKSNRAGRGVCSFSAETVGMEACLDLLQWLKRDIPHDSRIVVFLDSQSYLSSMEKGMVRQTDGRLASHWRRIIRFVASRGWYFSLRFIYGHSHLLGSDRADTEARIAAVQGARTDRLLWWKDEVRNFTQIALAKHLPVFAVNTLRMQAKVPIAPSRWSKASGCTTPAAAITTLCQLRLDACPRLGGHLIRVTALCPKCRKMTQRGCANYESLVVHMFKCYRARGLRRQLRVRGLRTLWTNPRRALAYVAKFAGWEVGA